MHRATSFILRVTLAVAGHVVACQVAEAQPLRPRAAVSPFVESEGVHAGTVVRVALRVSLPDGVHVQADKPRDPALIPTLLTLVPPPGVTVTEIVYPEPLDLVQAGQQTPLAVFEQDFLIGARLTIARTLPPGEIHVGASLHYQACDATACYAPASADIQWPLRIVPRGKAIQPQNAALFEQIRFGRGPAPSSR